MWFKDAIGKAIGEVVGKMVANVQGVVAEELRGQLWREIKFGPAHSHSIFTHVYKYGTELYRSGTQVFRAGTGEIHPLHVVYRYQGYFVCISHTETTSTFGYTRGLDLDKLLRLADSTTYTSSYVATGTKKGDDSDALDQRIDFKKTSC